MVMDHCGALMCAQHETVDEPHQFSVYGVQTNISEAIPLPTLHPKRFIAPEVFRRHL